MYKRQSLNKQHNNLAFQAQKSAQHYSVNVTQQLLSKSLACDQIKLLILFITESKNLLTALILFTGNYAVVDDSRSVVFRIFTKERISYNGFSQIALRIALPDSCLLYTSRCV